MVSHNAADQMLGYPYQVRYALNLLMSSDDPSSINPWDKLIQSAMFGTKDTLRSV